MITYRDMIQSACSVPVAPQVVSSLPSPESPSPRHLTVQWLTVDNKLICKWIFT